MPRRAEPVSQPAARPLHTDAPSVGQRLILDAALALFLRDGYERVSVADIAGRAGISKANVFHHFASKEALYVAVIREAVRGHADFAESLARLEDESSAELLRRLAVWEFEHAFHERGQVRMLIHELFASHGAEAQRIARTILQRNFDAVTTLIREGQRRGEFRADLDAAVAASVLGAVSGMYAHTRDGLRRMPGCVWADDPRAYALATCELLLSGLRMSVAAPA